MKSIPAFPALALLLAQAFCTPGTPAHTMNLLARDLAQFEGGVEYDFVPCDSANAEVQVTMLLPAGGRPERRSLEWFFRRDTMSQRRWDSLLTSQELNSGAPAVYILPTGRLRTIRANGHVADSVVHRSDFETAEPMLFPRKNNRILLYGDFLPSVESTGDTTFAFGAGKGARSVRIRRIRKAIGPANPSLDAPLQRNAR